MEPQAECMLVLMDATPRAILRQAQEERIGFQTGMRESGQSWKELLVDLQARISRRRSSSPLPPRPGSATTRSRADPYARWVASTSAGCRARSMSCAASIADDGSSGTPRQGPSRTRARHRQWRPCGATTKPRACKSTSNSFQLCPGFRRSESRSAPPELVEGLPSGVASISTSMHSACSSTRACK